MLGQCSFVTCLPDDLMPIEHRYLRYPVRGVPASSFRIMHHCLSAGVLMPLRAVVERALEFVDGRWV
jgi:hypothetical protein